MLSNVATRRAGLGLLVDGGLALGVQQKLHQQLVADEGQPALELLLVGDLLALGGLGRENHVGQIGDHLLALGVGVGLGAVLD